MKMAPPALIQQYPSVYTSAIIIDVPQHSQDTWHGSVWLWLWFQQKGKKKRTANKAISFNRHLFSKGDTGDIRTGDGKEKLKTSEEQTKFENIIEGTASPQLRHASAFCDTQSLFFQKKGWSGASAERCPWASDREREDGRETAAKGLSGCSLQEKGSSAPDRDSKELNITTQPDLEGICLWVPNGTLIKINSDK
ncbi:hypothetical protein CB1_001962003 [Camelus ferus]|nr:hypothetical protein CB1_001962003 [Camelus ferus]